MGKKINDEEIDNSEIMGDISGDDLSDVKKQLTKLKKESEDAEDSDESEITIMSDGDEDDDTKESMASEEIVINEENSAPFVDEDKYYKSFEKFLQDKEEEK